MSELSVKLFLSYCPETIWQKKKKEKNFGKHNLRNALIICLNNILNKIK